MGFEILLLVVLLGGYWHMAGRVRKLEEQMSAMEEVDSRHAPPGPAETQPPAEPEIAEPAPGPARLVLKTRDEPTQPTLANAGATEDDATEASVPVAADADPAVAKPRFALPAFDFEDIFGRRLPIWAGGVALAVGGIFLVLYAIEAGLLTPPVRVAASFAFGLLLLGAAEAAHRFEYAIADTRVRQALAGAGLATLYAAFYLAGAQYGLIGPGPAFVGLALVTAASLALAFRFGLPTAVLGLIGGFAAPVLVASEEANLPILAFYLAVLTAGLALAGRRMGHAWLGAAALTAGFAWGILMLLGDPGGQAERAAIGIYLLALGAAIPIILGDVARLPFLKLASGAIAIVQMGFLVGLAGFDLLTWGLYLLLAAALAVLAWRAESLRPAGALVAALGILLLAIWPDPPVAQFAVVAAGLALIVIGAPLAHIWAGRGDRLQVVQLAAASIALGLAILWQFGHPDNAVFQPGIAAAMAGLAALCAGGLWRLWSEPSAERLLALPAGGAGLLAFAALHQVLPPWAEVLGASVVALALAELVRRRPLRGLAGVAWAVVALGFAALLTVPLADTEVPRLVGESGDGRNLGLSLLRWSSLLLPLGALALFLREAQEKRVAEALAGLVVYGLLAQLVPADWLALLTALAAVTAIVFATERVALWGALLALAGMWSLQPIGAWLEGALDALGGRPMLVVDVPDVSQTLRRVLPFAVAAVFAAWRMPPRFPATQALSAIAGALALVALHSLYKHAFGIVGPIGFERFGLAERTVWQALLIGGGIALVALGPTRKARIAGAGLATAGLAHFALFTAFWHNPLWTAQATGPLPLANLLLPAYGLAGIGIWWLASRFRPALPARSRWFGDALLMLLIFCWALSELRHGFAGSILTSQPLGQGEDLLRSLLGIVLALGYLWWGSRTGQRSWRIGSLVLMLLAVAKVFVVDAAGLGGLLRIASFMALGVSLIGIGWVYSRQLSSGNDRSGESGGPA